MITARRYSVSIRKTLTMIAKTLANGVPTAAFAENCYKAHAGMACITPGWTRCEGKASSEWWCGSTFASTTKADQQG